MEKLSAVHGVAEVLTLQSQRAGGRGAADQRAYFFDTLAEYQWARHAEALMPSSIDQLVKPVTEICDHYDLVLWELTSRHVDHYFAGPGKRVRGTVRTKINNIDGYCAFLEQRFAGEIARRFGARLESPSRYVQQAPAPRGLRAEDPVVPAGDARVLRRVA
ncbi:hypothetical protein [Streptomyces tauricus]|uniref:hypothetical protein n=1 Tax=Streptomyces tauricus TaxID=68274 RepID=UPI003814AF3E